MFLLFVVVILLLPILPLPIALVLFVVVLLVFVILPLPTFLLFLPPPNIPLPFSQRFPKHPKAPPPLLVPLQLPRRPPLLKRRVRLLVRKHRAAVVRGQIFGFLPVCWPLRDSRRHHVGACWAAFCYAFC
ncbi:unnamed protein product [Periconia digitata]|uniref:Uncharacterized protein n=1 Tax=Periconia digitata TaxID=1303443 RepID=A0A9W4XT74_9PLEO|nr:unnamed protein product [Periconia digitata]